MLRKVGSLLILCSLFLSVFQPVDLAVLHSSGQNKVLVNLDLCHASSPLRTAGAVAPFCPGQLCLGILSPGFAGYFTFSGPAFRPSLFACRIENPPRA